MSINDDLEAFLDDEMGGSDERIGVSQYLDTGIPELNFALTGHYKRGVPVGRIMEVFGPSASGKTFLATMAMASAQKAGGIACFSDHERTFDPVLGQSLGLSLEKGKWLYQRPMTFEESIHNAMKLCEGIRTKGLIPDDAPIIWVFDSLATMVPHEKLYNDKGERRDPKEVNMRLKLALATATSQNFPALAQFAEDFNMAVLFLNQIRTKPGVLHGDPTSTPGGQAPEFYCTHRVSLGRKIITNGQKGDKREDLGFEVNAVVKKNKLAPPFKKAKWQVLFNNGSWGVTIDHVTTLVDFLVRKGLIPKAGNRVEWEGKKLYQSVLVSELKEDDKAIDKLMALVPDSDAEMKDVTESEFHAELENKAKAKTKAE